MGCARPLVLLVLLAATTACAGVERRHDGLSATLWIQTAAEYRATAMQTFDAAARRLDDALADPDWTAAVEQTGDFSKLPPAVVLDVDETVLDNSRYAGELISRDLHVSVPELWDLWVAQRSAPLVPGVNTLIRAATERGVAVVLITNRKCVDRTDGSGPCPQEADTIANLKNAGFAAEITPETIHLKYERPEWTSEKKTRRQHVARDYRILMLLGDDFGDLLPDVKRDITHEERRAILERHADKPGSKWFVLPNPTYGSWIKVLGEDVRGSVRGMERQ